jgi:hypothetical protein
MKNTVEFPRAGYCGHFHSYLLMVTEMTALPLTLKGHWGHEKVNIPGMAPSPGMWVKPLGSPKDSGYFFQVCEVSISSEEQHATNLTPPMSC